jgi:two-component system response regulator NreC
MIQTEVKENEIISSRSLKYIIKDDEDITGVAEAFNELEVFKITSEKKPEIIILECFIHNTEELQITKYIKNNYPDTKIIIISEHHDEELMLRSFEAGVKGYLLKKDNADELNLAINKIKNGERYICSEASHKMLDKIKEIVNHMDSQTPLEINLSGRELEVLQLISQGLTNNEIAEKIFTSRRTVETHRKMLIEKTKTKNTAALIKFAMINKLIK